MWRSRKSRKMMREIVKRMYDVRYDIDTGDMYYYHILKKTKQQLKPRIMGHEKLTPPDYARVRDEKNVPLYYDTKRPWLSSEEKPEGYLLCTWCSSAKRENFNYIPQRSRYYSLRVTAHVKNYSCPSYCSSNVTLEHRY